MTASNARKQKMNGYIAPPDGLTDRQTELWELAVTAPLTGVGLRPRWATLAMELLLEVSS